MAADFQNDPTAGETGGLELSGCVKCGDPFNLEADCQEKPQCSYCDVTSHEMEDCPDTKRCNYCQLGGHEEAEGCPHANEGEDRVTERPVNKREERIRTVQKQESTQQR
jgi:hypothetical protein